MGFLLFLDTDVIEVAEIYPLVRQIPDDPTSSIQWLLMTWPRVLPGHQQPGYWPGFPGNISTSSSDELIPVIDGEDLREWEAMVGSVWVERGLIELQAGGFHDLWEQ